MTHICIDLKGSRNGKVGRKDLEPRREPYWHKLSQARYLGFRKTGAVGDENGTWVARFTENRKYTYNALGDFTESFGFDEAKVAAEAWFADRERGVTGRTASGEQATVELACREYVEHLRKEKGEASAHDADMRFRRTVYGDEKNQPHAIAALRLDRVRSKTLKDWRDWLLEPREKADGNQKVMSKASANRTLTSVKAALNLAVSNRLVTADRIQEWREVKPYKNASKRRDIFLDLAQRRALLAAAADIPTCKDKPKQLGALKDLVQGVAFTGCRAGELTNANRQQFDARTKTLKVTGKTGTRSIPLSTDASEWFEGVSRRSRARQLQLSAEERNERLFTRDDGKPWAHSDWDELVREAASNAGLQKGVCLYTLRHSFITEALMGGMSTLEVARMVGTSVQMIELHYGHLVANTARERLEKVALL